MEFLCAHCKYFKRYYMVENGVFTPVRDGRCSRLVPYSERDTCRNYSADSVQKLTRRIDCLRALDRICDQLAAVRLTLENDALNDEELDMLHHLQRALRKSGGTTADNLS